MPAATSRDHVIDKPHENLLSNALREMLSNLDVKDVTPETIISRFSKSGGIDRVRIAIEHRMKDFLESHKRHTVSASEEYLNRVVSDGDDGLHPQKLMQQTQDVVLATVKDRIGRDIDSVTEQGKAGWFLECIRDEIVNVIKGEEKVAKIEEEPVPTKPAIDGARAILSNLTRAAVRARHADHAHDSVRHGLTKDTHANAHPQDAANGTLNQSEKQAVVKENETRSEMPHENRKKQVEIEADAKSNRKEAKVALKSPKHKVEYESARKNGHASSRPTPASADFEKKELPSGENIGAKEEDSALQSTKEDMEYDSLADEVLLGENVPSDVEMTVEEKPENVLTPTDTPMAEGQSDSKDQNDFKATSRPGATKAVGGDQGREGLPADSVTQSVTPEKNKVRRSDEVSKVQAACKVDDGDAENEGSTSKTQETSELEVAKGPESEDLRKLTDDKSVPVGETPRTRKPRKDDVHPASEKASIVEDAKDSTCDAKVTEEEELSEQNPNLDADQDGKQAEAHKVILEEKKTIPEPSKESKDKSKAATESMEKAKGSAAKDGQEDASTRGTYEATKSNAPSNGKDQHSEVLKGHATNPSRRSARRISSRTPVASDHYAVDSTEGAEEEPGSQTASKTKKGKTSKARKNEEGNAEKKTARKKARKETSKDQNDSRAKKRKRSPAGQDMVQEAGQPSGRPDPAVENWPRGYGVTRSCVPDDYTEQKKVLHALEMVLKQEYAEPFSEPVDTTEDGLEIYTSVIKNPMDLGEICRRLRNSSAGCGYYGSVTEILQDVDLVWWNCREYNGQFDPVVVACERTQQEFTFLLEQHGIAVEKGTQKRRRVSRGRAVAPQSPEPEPDLGDNDGRLVGKSILIFTELKKRKKEWFKVDVKSYDKKTKTYSLFWEETGKTTKKATFGTDKVFPVYRA